MDARFYNTEELDIEKLANDLESIYRTQGFQAQHIGTDDQVLVQLKKGGDFESLIGMQSALSVTIQKSGGGVLATIGQQKWIDKAAVGAIGIIAFPILWPLTLTAGIGAMRQASLANKVLNVLDGLVTQQQPGVRVGPIPVQVVPIVQQQYAPPPQWTTPPQYVPPTQYAPPQPAPPYVPPQPAPRYVPPQPAPAPAPTKLRCSTCNTPYEAGDTFCSGCGKSLKTLCPNCKAEVKPGVAFCPKCGASTFQSATATQAAPVAPTVATPKVTYTPPTTPAPQAKPAIPTYTPPASPPPRPAPQPTAQPYVPPASTPPPAMPKPTITITPAVPSGDSSAAPKAPPAPKPLYTPPAVPVPPPPSVRPQAATPKPPDTIKARPVAQPAFDPSTPWGTLTFNDGKSVPLSGERALVGRYDHDLGGINPEIDLNGMDGADTVSRVHASIEHIGSTYMLMDLNSTNSTHINGKRLEPDKATPINDGDTLAFGKVTCTFKKL